MICSNCKQEIILSNESNACNNCGTYIFESFYSIFNKPPLLNGNVFPELKIKYLKGKSSEVNFIDYYYRKFHYGDININKSFNKFCETLHKLKNNSEQDIEILFSMVKNLFINGNYVIITIPSHNPQIIDTGIKKLVKLILRNNNSTIDGTDYLIRIKEINQHGQSRTIKEQYNSMQLKKGITIENKIILLFDDIYTTGNTINAAKTLIEKENPKHIEKFALAKTYYKNG